MTKRAGEQIAHNRPCIYFDRLTHSPENMRFGLLHVEQTKKKAPYRRIVKNYTALFLISAGVRLFFMLMRSKL